MEREIKISTQTLYHSLVHFGSISSQVVSELLAAGYSKEQVDMQLGDVGSKFNDDFATSPQEVLAMVEQYFPRSIAEAVWDSDNRCRVSFAFDRSIGTENVVAVSDLIDSERASIREVYRGEYLVRATTSLRVFETNLCQVIVGGDEQNLELITLFPGVLTPPLPKTNYMSDPFWSQYVFIKK